MTKQSRRAFIATSSAGLAVLAAGSYADSHGLQKLSTTDPIAVALGYQPVAENVDVNKFPKRAGDSGAKQFCSNCALYKEVEDGHGSCSAIPGKLVAGAGWCNAWVPVS